MKRSTFVAATAAAVAVAATFKDNVVTMSYGPWQKDAFGLGATRLVRANAPGFPGKPVLMAYQTDMQSRVLDSKSIAYVGFGGTYTEKECEHKASDPKLAHQECVSEAERHLLSYFNEKYGRVPRFRWVSKPSLRVDAAKA